MTMNLHEHYGIAQLVHANWPTRYAVGSAQDQSLFWSNEFGWVERYYDTFSREETEELDLPINGRWVALTPKGEPA
jgi:hypothetical protein